jgi:hypothetical protein
LQSIVTKYIYVHVTYYFFSFLVYTCIICIVTGAINVNREWLLSIKAGIIFSVFFFLIQVVFLFLYIYIYIHFPVLSSFILMFTLLFCSIKNIVNFILSRSNVLLSIQRLISNTFINFTGLLADNSKNFTPLSLLIIIAFIIVQKIKKLHFFYSAKPRLGLNTRLHSHIL